MSNGRILHTMLRVGDLDRSIEFYTNVMGMNVLRRNENKEYEYTLVFVGYGDESQGSVIELTYNWELLNTTLVTRLDTLLLALTTSIALVTLSKRQVVTSLESQAQ